MTSELTSEGTTDKKMTVGVIREITTTGTANEILATGTTPNRTTRYSVGNEYREEDENLMSYTEITPGTTDHHEEHELKKRGTA